MVESRVLQIVRQFRENAIKLLLEDPKNARDLLALCGADSVKRIDLRRVKLVQTTFVERDYRHVESDVVLLGPLRRRWLELVSYIMALVYHAREPSKWPSLQQAIEASVQTDEHRREIFEMRRTIADELEERGAIKNRQRAIRATNDPEQLDDWLDQVVTAETLAEVGIEVPA